MRILFIGNSHTYFNDMPHLCAELLRAAGKDVEVTMLTRGGETLHGHILSEQTRFNILFGHYDWVILQEATGDFQRETDQELPAESKAASQAEKIEL